MQAVAPVLAHEHIVDVIAQTVKSSLISLHSLSFDKGFVQLRNLIRLLGRNTRGIRKLQGFEVLDGCRAEPPEFSIDLSQQQACTECKFVVFDGMLQMTDGALESVTT